MCPALQSTRCRNTPCAALHYVQVRDPSARVEHEASTSKIGEDQLFYFQQRGIDVEDAVGMIISGFCREVRVVVLGMLWVMPMAGRWGGVGLLARRAPPRGQLLYFSWQLCMATQMTLYPSRSPAHLFFYAPLLTPAGV
jgi:hypothetical protein